MGADPSRAPRQERCSLSSGIPDGLVGHEGRLHDDKDVPIRLAVVLSRSNRVLTLRRIVHTTADLRRSGGRIAPSGGKSCIPFSLPHLLRTRVGVVSVVRLLTSPTGGATVAAQTATGNARPYGAVVAALPIESTPHLQGPARRARAVAASRLQ